MVFKPKFEVCLPGVLRDVDRWSIPWCECSIEDVPDEGLRAWQARARALVLAAIVVSTASRMIAMAGSFPQVAVGASVASMVPRASRLWLGEVEPALGGRARSSQPSGVG